MVWEHFRAICDGNRFLPLISMDRDEVLENVPLDFPLRVYYGNIDGADTINGLGWTFGTKTSLVSGR